MIGIIERLGNNQGIEKRRKDAEIIKGKWKGKKRGEAKKPWVCCMKKDQGHAMKERDTKKDQGTMSMDSTKAA